MNKEKKIVAICCQWGGLSSADQAGKRGLRYSGVVRIIGVRCLGQVDLRVMLEPFLSGADGVMLVGCAENHCHYRLGNYVAYEKAELAKMLLEMAGQSPDRVTFHWLKEADGEGFTKAADYAAKLIAEMPPLPAEGAAFDAIRAARMAAEDQRLRWLVGTAGLLREMGNVFGRSTPAEDIRSALSDAAYDAFMRCRIGLQMLKKGATPPQLAASLGADVGVISRLLTEMEHDGLIKVVSTDNGFPVFGLAGSWLKKTE